MTNKEGWALGYFYVHFKDNYCFPLRFFQPTPDVEKEPQHYTLAEGRLEITNALRPGIVDYGVKIAMTTVYSETAKTDKENQGETQITPCGELRIGEFEIVSVNGHYALRSRITWRSPAPSIGRPSKWIGRLPR